MKKILNKKIMNLIKESQEFGISDKLSEVLGTEYEGELSETELEMTAAAGIPNYGKFQNYITNHK